MKIRFAARAIAAAGSAVLLFSAFHAPTKPEDEFAGIVKAYLSMGQPTDWEGVEKLPNIRWAALPPTALQNCLPDGGCFTRQGAATIGGRNVVVVATGARTMVSHIYFRNIL